MYWWMLVVRVEVYLCTSADGIESRERGRKEGGRERESTCIFFYCLQGIISCNVSYWPLFELNCLVRVLGRSYLFTLSWYPSMKSTFSFWITVIWNSWGKIFYCTSVWSSPLYEQLLLLRLIIMTNKK